MSNSSSCACILLVEDEPDIADLIEFHLRKAGFEVQKAHNGEVALKLVSQQRFDLVVLDLMIPKIDGLEVFKRLRSKPSTASLPVIMLTAKGQASDRVAGLEAGADDYMTKPFSPKELVLRIRKQIEVASRTTVSYLYEIGNLSFDRVESICRVNGELVDLTVKEFKLLLHLCENPNKIQTRNTLLERVWGYAEGVNSRTLDTHMKRIRLKLGDHVSQIKTIRGQGYVFEVDSLDSIV